MSAPTTNTARGWDFPTAWSAALRRTAAREYGSAEMRQYLVLKGVPEDVASRVVDRMAREKLIDDTRFSRALVRDQALRDKGPRAILMKLVTKGVESDLRQVRALLSETTGEDEEQAVRRIVKKRYPGALRAGKERERAYGALLRRGFSRDAILSVLRAAGRSS